MTSQEFQEGYPEAFEILHQIGGSRIVPMIGAKMIVPQADSLTVHFRARAKDGIKVFAITLTPLDLYEVKFYTAYGTMVKEFNNVYYDQLKNLIQSTTGLYLTL